MSDSRMLDQRDVAILMRDGVPLRADVLRPVEDVRYPALIALQPWGQDHEELARRFPYPRRPSPLWDGIMESGDTEFFVNHEKDQGKPQQPLSAITDQSK